MAKMQSRRAFLASTASGAALAPLVATQATAEVDPIIYEVQRSDAEWRAILEPEPYRILREGGTEPQFSSPKVSDFRAGTFQCGGCDLTVYSSQWRAVVQKGWVFFDHSEPDTVLTGIDGAVSEYGQMSAENTNIEAHCRRCGSHLGHIVHIEGRIRHCINGFALNFTPA
ncbi:peptide-methionine (R)-S-oxide reductase [Pontivivens insulae]|uniref:peptide-methionine (R)-S-oxide reductase n=1 Tax=Pontivivens insulae TaxID=1639689 RepID=A0A2R8AET2_9RHOB|nr:peptide-methionine (R)-S-oxide reductase [Pontivivens insulae]RED11983.1 peptide-methionine (R)-S-oxide reductase [Pontivivens insulae]SPF30739.1 Peptide methionine sulfoxide reductase MsrB [Pontivivens insulae]